MEYLKVKSLLHRVIVVPVVVTAALGGLLSWIKGVSLWVGFGRAFVTRWRGEFMNGDRVTLICCLSLVPEANKGRRPEKSVNNV